MNVSVIPVVVGALRTIPKEMIMGLEDMEIRGQVDTIKTTALIRFAKILRLVLETWDLLLLKFLWENIR